MASTGIPPDTAQGQAQASAPGVSAPTGSNTPSFSSLGIKNTNIPTAAGVDLSDRQKVIVGSVLDLFEGNPTLKHFGLWSRDATFADPITTATGYPRYTAQFYGLPALFDPIRLQSFKVTAGGNPIEMEMSNKYVVKGIKKEQVVNSVVRIFLGQDGKIEKVEDRWNGTLPEGAISDVSQRSQGSLLNPLAVARWTAKAGSDMAWWAFCNLSWWSPFLVRPRLPTSCIATRGVFGIMAG